jgi:hypothetical protein
MEMTPTHHFPVVTIFKIIMEMVLTTLQYHIKFIFKQHVFAITLSLTRKLLFEICSLVNGLLILKEMKDQETIF